MGIQPPPTRLYAVHCYVQAVARMALGLTQLWFHMCTLFFWPSWFTRSSILGVQSYQLLHLPIIRPGHLSRPFTQFEFLLCPGHHNIAAMPASPLGGLHTKSRGGSSGYWSFLVTSGSTFHLQPMCNTPYKADYVTSLMSLAQFQKFSKRPFLM
jgi:hypothetical protein